MGQVSLLINGYSYLVGCEDGQEAHLQSMGRDIQKRIDSIRALGQTGEARLLVLVSLLMADELHDKDAVLAMRGQATAPPPIAPLPVVAAPAAAPEPAKPDPRLLETIRRLADRAEEIAASLEHA